jgi:ribosomal protein L37AE/L43A
VEGTDGVAQLKPVCPRCHSALASRLSNGCRCDGCGMAYPKRAQVDVFLTDTEWAECVSHLRAESAISEKYQFARRKVPLT